MLPKRIIPCLDIKDGRVVKGTGFADLREAGDPIELAGQYEADGADELVFLDIAATGEGRSPTIGLAERTADNVFIPFTVGGGVRGETDVQRLLDAGADKVAINSAALADPPLLNKLMARFGSQCVVLAMDVKKAGDGSWQVYANAGQVATGREASAWAREAVGRGAGEILLTSIDRDGTQDGYDLDVTKLLTDQLTVPVIASGGAGQIEHYVQAIGYAGAEAVLAASQLHAGHTTVGVIKARLTDKGILTRPPSLVAQKASLLSPRPRVAVVDYGTGNRRSVQQALLKSGASVSVTDEHDAIADADGIVLPGVGAFGPAMDCLDDKGLTKLLKELAVAGKPFLGICLGEQLLFESSEENGRHEGLGLLKGEVSEIESPIRPNIGWRSLKLARTSSLMSGLKDNYFYHLHQYAARANPAIVMATTPLPYAGNPDYEVPTVVGRGNVFGVQFHPEKSGPSGLRLLRNFVELCAAEAGSPGSGKN